MVYRFIVLVSSCFFAISSYGLHALKICSFHLTRRLVRGLVPSFGPVLYVLVGDSIIHCT